MKRRFTLIEMLTSVTIIAILAAMLLPALGRAHNKALKAACTGNLRQLCTAFMLYHGDYQGRLPPTSTANLVHGGTNWAWYMLPYYKNVDILNCPSSPNGPPSSTHQSLHLYDGNYGWNFSASHAQRGPIHSCFPAPSQGYLLMDSGDPCIIHDGKHWKNLLEELDLDWDSGAEGANRHDNQVNVCFADGHVSPRKLHEFLAAPNPANSAPWYIPWENGCLVPDIIPFPVH